jgi:hypothetical protein
MTTTGSKEQHLFDLAFELAYFIHVNKEVAFFVAEDALDGLGSMLDHHEKNRKPSYTLRGFLKSGERTRPIRKSVRLKERQMLQWLVYKQSESWERQTEQGKGPYLPTEEDLIVRYVEHLVFITLRRGSFYVTLAIGSLLHQFDRRETRLFHDIVTQSDSARMKDTNYIGKQRLEMLERVSRRFGDMVQMAKSPGEENQFVMRPTTQWVSNVVNESLRRFTPWETACGVEPGFDVTDIPGLYFSETSASDEELIEMNRIHTILHPVCFAQFADGLSRYVLTLPNGDQDKACNYQSPDERLVVPQFSNFPCGTPRGDRFQPPKLTEEDYIRLQRTLEARSHRRKNFKPQQLCVYVDDLFSCSFDWKNSKRVRQLLASEAGFLEVRGVDNTGELTLAFLFLDHVSGEGFRGSVVNPNGQRVTVSVRPVQKSDESLGGVELEVSYEEGGLIPPLYGLVQRVWVKLFNQGSNERSDQLWGRHAWLAIASVALLLIIVILSLVWWRVMLPGPRQEARSPQQIGQPQSKEGVEDKGQVSSASPSPPPKPSPIPREQNKLIARANWSTDREAVLRTIQIEPTRSIAQAIDLSSQKTNVLLSLPVYDNQGRKYLNYRLTLFAAETVLWKQTLRAPKVSLTGYAHIVDLLLFGRRVPNSSSYDLQIEGKSAMGWQPLGHVGLRSDQQ